MATGGANERQRKWAYVHTHIFYIQLEKGYGGRRYVFTSSLNSFNGMFCELTCPKVHNSRFGMAIVLPVNGEYIYILPSRSAKRLKNRGKTAQNLKQKDSKLEAERLKT